MPPKDTLPPLPNIKETALFLDIDGTLAPIASTPDKVHLRGYTLCLLETLYEQSGGALAMISGRSLHSIDQLCNPLELPAAGQHGLEVRLEIGAKPDIMADPMPILALESEIEALKADFPELFVEYKGLSIAVHFREAPHLEEVVRYSVADIIRPFAEQVCLQWGKKVCEIRLRGGDKGSAIENLMQAPLFRTRPVPVFAGDDLTDEKGFAAVNRLKGISIKIGAGETVADYRLPDIESLHSWLEALAGTHINREVRYG